MSMDVSVMDFHHSVSVVTFATINATDWSVLIASLYKELLSKLFNQWTHFSNESMTVTSYIVSHPDDLKFWSRRGLGLLSH